MADNGVINRKTCSICLEPFKTPKILQCFHTFCAQCLKDIIKNKRRVGSFECPLCRASITIPKAGIDGFQNNFYIQDQGSDNVRLLCNGENGDQHQCHETAINPIIGETYNLVLSCCSYGDLTRQCIVQVIDAVPRKCPAPTLKKKPVDTSITMTWEVPMDDSSSSVTRYKVKMSSNGEIDNEVYNGRKAYCEVENLTPGKKYNIYVQAQNVVGWGSWSDALEVILDPCPPGKPKCFSIEDISSTSVTLTWTEADDNGEKLTGYVIKYNVKDDLVSNSLDVEYTACRHVVDNLKPGTKYSFQICAVNVLGKGKLSKKLKCTTIPLLPSQLSSVLIQTPTTAESLEMRIKPELYLTRRSFWDNLMSVEEAVFTAHSEKNRHSTPLVRTDKRLVARYYKNKSKSNSTILKKVLQFIASIIEFLVTYLLLTTHPETVVIFIFIILVAILFNGKQQIFAFKHHNSRRNLKRK
ncbi:hypothetical protein ACJMK2_033855 [Sinanodonta woodiana]|uniref:Uncharacterized protein n=1 Tax=Sinanodonta woodiana TaxID=1069815 RepID=A0ABD3WPP4_SINWO